MKRSILTLLGLLLPLSTDANPQAPAADTGPAAIQLDLAKIRFSKVRQDLWRSSLFWNPRNPAGGKLFAKSFLDPRAARVFGLWWWQARAAKDIESFAAALETRRASTEWLFEREDKLIVHIAWMPPWLSRTDSKRKLANESYEFRNAVGPADPAKWKEAIQVFARFLKSCRKGKDCDLYYEFWNEPDLFYWQGDLDEFLELYEHTAQALKAVDPDAKVGGCAANGWRNKLSQKRYGDKPITQLLIEYCGRKKLPLDFVSWHWFDYRTKEVEEAARAIRGLTRKAGFSKQPELLITEWNSPRVIRDSRYQPFLMADFFLASRRAGIDIQCMAAWQDFHPEPKSEHYGLITHEGEKRLSFDVHMAFDAMSRCKEGTYMLQRRGEEDRGSRLRVVLGNEGEGRYRLLIWRSGQTPGTTAAMRYLRSQGVAASVFQGVLPHEVADMISEGTPDRDENRAAWREAQRIQAKGQAPSLDLAFLGTLAGTLVGKGELHVRQARGYLSTLRKLDAHVKGNRISLDLEPYELASLEIEIR